MKKESAKTQEKVKSRTELMKSMKARMDKWERMERGDIRALIELSVECGLNKKEDFPDYFRASYARVRPPPYEGEICGFGE